MNNAVMYLRVSTDQQDYQRQKVDLDNFAKHDELNIIKIFTDKLSGTKDENQREGLSDMKKYLLESNTKIVLVWEISRLGRKQSILAALMDFFEENHINVYFFSQKIWLLENNKISFGAGLMLNILGYYAGYELSLMKERMKSAKAKNISLGKIVSGSTIFGYKVGEDKKIIIDDDLISELGISKADIVKELFETYNSGLSTNEIRRMCIAKKYPKHLHINSNVTRILRNEDYKGGSMHKLGFRPVPPIIEPWLWNNCAERRNNNNTRKDKSSKYINLLKDILVCSICNGKCATKLKAGYLCSNNLDVKKASYGTSCDSLVFSENALNGIIWTYSQPYISYLKTQEAQKDQENQTNKKIEELEKSIKQYANIFDTLETKRKKLNIMLKSDTIDVSSFEKEAKNIKNERSKTEKHIIHLQSEIELFKNKLNEKIQIKEILQTATNITDTKMIKQLINSVIKEVKYYGITRFDKIIKIQRQTGEIDYLYYYSQLKKEFFFIINQNLMFFSEEKKQLYFTNQISTFLLRTLYKIEITDNIVPLELIRQTLYQDDTLSVASVVAYDRLNSKHKYKQTHLTQFKHIVKKEAGISPISGTSVIHEQLTVLFKSIIQIIAEAQNTSVYHIYKFIETTFSKNQSVTTYSQEELDILISKIIKLASSELNIHIELPQKQISEEEDKEPYAPYSDAYTIAQWFNM